jgi:hypothetical protein
MATKSTKAATRKSRARQIRTNFQIAKFDARPDRLDFRDLPYAAPLRSLAPRWPDDRDLRAWLPSYVKAGLILDQGREGACTGFGLAGVVNYLFWVRHLGAPSAPPFRPVSPRMLYELARRYDEWQGDGYEGSSCRGALKGWHKHGVCADALWPYRGKDGDVRLLLPREGWDVDAVSRPLGVYYRLNRRSVVDMQAAIAQIGAVYVSARVHDGWDAVPEVPRPPRSHDGLPLIASAKNPKKTGGHAFALVGYNERGFVVQNSWGQSWGARGFAVMSYADWVAYGTDAWACSLGVPQERARQPRRIDALRWPSRSGRSLGFFDFSPRNPDNPPDDPWPIDRDFEHRPYQPWTTAEAYAHTLVTGNDGRVSITDVTAGVDGDAARLVREIACTRPQPWLAAQAKPRLMIYAHGGLNSQAEAIDRIRVLAPYFEANGIYPLFLTWRTGPLETLNAMLEDKFRSYFGVSTAEEMRAAGFIDELADARDRRVEELARLTLKGLWSEMRENAERGAEAGHGLALLAQSLAQLRDTVPGLELHLVGHSAGALLLGHLLGVLAAPPAGAVALNVAGCTLFAPACSLAFALDKYLGAAAAILPSQRITLHCLADREEKDDFLAGVKGLHLYGKSLLYLVSRALDDERKMPLLGLQRAVTAGWEHDADQWAAAQLPSVQAWLARFQGRVQALASPSVVVNRKGQTMQAQHGSFDNNVALMTQTIEGMRGAKLVRPIEWLDY